MTAALERPAAKTRTVSAPHLRFFTETREVEATISTEEMGRDNMIVISAGLDFSGYMARNPVVLFDHNSARPIGRSTAIWRSGSTVQARCQFAEPGVSDDADMVYGLVKGGIINSVSIGYLPITSEPIISTPGARRITKSELIEWSFVSVPALSSAVVTSRGIQFRPKGVCNLHTIEGRREYARQRLEWIGVEDRRAHAEELVARLRRRGLLD